MRPGAMCGCRSESGAEVAGLRVGVWCLHGYTVRLSVDLGKFLSLSRMRLRKCRQMLTLCLRTARRVT